jgi:hypothetical protein
MLIKKKMPSSAADPDFLVGSGSLEVDPDLKPQKLKHFC